ncbi:MAG: hypothetical protein CENE_01919 [Candidatus Celerinatantimonas neptuna]|nr:MAG: hypothetical protein CENE_01919 [Candidatus Celerinatantimonas neptuna]
MLIKGQIKTLGQNNLTIHPKAKAQIIRCSSIELSDGRIIDGPLQMDTTIYDALQSQQELEIAIYQGGLFFKRSVQSVRFSNGTVVRNHDVLFRQFFTLSSLTAIALYLGSYFYFSHLLDVTSGLRAALLSITLWALLSILAWLRFQHRRYRFHITPGRWLKQMIHTCSKH